MLWLRPVQFVAQALTDGSSPRQLAWGIALGMLIGLVPKENLTAVALVIAVSALRVNLAAVSGSALVFAWSGVLLDPLSHRLGLALLEADLLRPFWTWLFERPLMPWTSFNNSVVLGSLLIGLMLMYPVYRGVRPLCVRYLPVVEDRLKQLRIVRVLWGIEVAGSLRSAA